MGFDEFMRDKKTINVVGLKMNGIFGALRVNKPCGYDMGWKGLL